jgi:acyl-CoA reductase-like NAD-dependent aldehyde dehydrogenase
MFLPEEVIEDSNERKVSTRYRPLGVGVGIIPWNYPIQPMATGKIGPALLTGNVLILKPSPFTPYCGLKLAELGTHFFPPGVLQALAGDDKLGPWLTEHPDVDKVSFTGSVSTGKQVIRSCSANLKRFTLELGGNDAAVICADVDPAAIAPFIAGVALANAGQICCTIKRIYIHESVYRPMLSSLVAVVQHMKAGDGFETGPYFGPITTQPQYEKVKGLLAEIAESRLEMAIGSTELPAQSAERHGYFIEPAIVDNPPKDSRIVTEEQFGELDLRGITSSGEQL